MLTAKMILKKSKNNDDIYVKIAVISRPVVILVSKIYDTVRKIPEYRSFIALKVNSPYTS